MTPAQAPAQAPAEPAEPASEPATAPQGDPGNGAAPEGGERERGEDGRLLSREAAAYRRQLRETQAERDQLREQIDALQREQVERLAAQSGLAVASDVWLHGATLDSLRAEDGSVDSETVSGVVEAIVKDRPGLKAPRNGDIGIGRGAAARPPQTPPVGLSQLLKP